MGNTNSTPRNGPGPQLSNNERMAMLSPDTTESWLKNLECRADPSRKDVIDILAPAVFASTSMEVTFDSLADDLLRVCNSDPDRLARMVRTPFLDGQSPICWVICNFPSDLFSLTLWDKLPPLLSVLLKCCPGWQKLPSAVDAIHKACCMRNSNELFQLLNPHSKLPSSSALIYSVDRRETGSGCEFEFVIQEFPSCMLVDGKVDMRFVCESRLCSVGFAVRGGNNRWDFFFRVVHDDPKAKGFLGEAAWPRVLRIDLTKKGEVSVLNGAT
ncbi:hypothetical protein BKA70DRAFT_1287539 [Coprinopsis sp. MPI-PUGE-AT-0042]|nr:hypothetical protein BKA70DRAFT_1287539 [Coprinopsis sp. MPI-PUGE-AT-0042]